jgi:hypothetical protein
LRALLFTAILVACASSSDPIPHGQSGECARCHLPEFQAAPDHSKVKPTTCAVCHGQTSFKPANVEHHWPLTGAHKKVDCFKCHTNNTFEGTKKLCYDCHREDYEKAPFHADLQHTCTDCHDTKRWKNGKMPPKPPPPPPSVSVPPVPTPSVSVPPVPSPSVSVKWIPKPKPTPTPTVTTKPPDIISHPSGH